MDFRKKTYKKIAGNRDFLIHQKFMVELRGIEPLTS